MEFSENSAVPPPDAVRFFRALADETRVAIVRLLALTDLRVGEIVAYLQAPQNAVSYHLRQLREIGLLRDQRSSWDGRDIYYRVDLDRLHTLYQVAASSLHPAMALAEGSPPPSTDDRPLRVLFLCTHNSARSQIAEAILRQLGRDRVEVYSAGSEPAPIHPLTLAILRGHGIDPSPHRSKSLEQFRGQQFDYIITVCDRVREVCPVFPGDPKRTHWSTPDPLLVEDEAARRAVFETVFRELQTRIQYLLLLPHPGTGQRMPSPGRPQPE